MAEAAPGDVICMNPGEVHDGAAIDREPRKWRMIYLDPEAAEEEIGEDFKGGIETTRP
ncbi:AraC family ligand binding domain-containing protein [Occallatibacter riparius]|uniref:AraC family ligand binding domain-containing protein n=1 Tax=Occallatibacter riparius TaxID=1002689 RepID=A0A9J7BU38_9BACT|nr:AraC family ligand binding domain-containing protein [Occallatibacter riparius]UWZ84446.1 AraC family ligand binding domain-containing protein [Occallatibacter riparius]